MFNPKQLPGKSMVQKAAPYGLIALIIAALFGGTLFSGTASSLGANLAPNGGPNDQMGLPVGFVGQEEGEGEGEGDEGITAEELNQSEFALDLVEVVVARTYIPVGERIRPELLEVQLRPNDNVAIRADVVFNDPTVLVGQIAKTDIQRGQAVLSSMIALNSTDLDTFGSDLSMFVENGSVAVAFPIDRYTGAAYAMRPGDFVDLLMSFNMLELDPEFQTALPNIIEVVDEEALQNGQAFLFPPGIEGRLEVILPEFDLVARIEPRGIISRQTTVSEEGDEASADAAISELTLQRPRRVTQLTIQRSEVLWVGTWIDQRIADQAEAVAETGTSVTSLPSFSQEGEDQSQLVDLPDVLPFPILDSTRSSLQPDMIILSMPVQDALVLKWALEEPGIDIDLALRAQGDSAVYFTTSVSLPQLVEQAGLTIPEPGEFGLQPRIQGSGIPRLPALPPAPEIAPPPQEFDQ